MLRGAVFGFGNMGRQFTRFVNGSEDLGARIVVAVNRGPAGLEAARSEFGLKATGSVEEALELGVDFVIVSSTTAAHAAQVIAAAARGCAVFCEKPIALNLADADRMIATVREAGSISVVNYIMRFNPGYRRIKDMIDAGELGEVLSVSHQKTRGYGLYAGGARHRAVVEPEESGGWAVHHACHDLDFLHWILGGIESVYGLTRSTAPGGGSEEVVEALLRFSSGAIGSISDSVSILRQHYTRVIGSKGSLLLTGENQDSLFLFQREGCPEGARRPEAIDVRDEKNPGGGLRHFLECVRSGTESPHDLAAARPSLAAALALQQSARCGLPVRPA